MEPSVLRRREFLAATSAGSVALAGWATRDVFADTDRQAKPPRWNVEMYGIVGDGATAVGDAVHTLLRSVAAAGGGVVYFPPGRYLFERTPLVGDDTILVGAGRSTVFEGVRPDGNKGGALLSNRGYNEPGYEGASNWGVRNVRIDSPDSNGIMPAHAENVRLENVYGDAIYYHHIDAVSSKNVVIDGYWASRGGDGNSDAPLQFDVQQAGTQWNGIWDGDSVLLVGDDTTPTTNCVLRDFSIEPENSPEYGVHIHRGGHESITITDGSITGCQFTAIRSDPEELVTNLSIENVSCLDNARGITLGHVSSGRRGLTVDDVVIRTDDNEAASGSGLYAAGFDGAEISNVTVAGEFTNSIIFDDMTNLEMTSVTAQGPVDQAFRFRDNVNVKLSNARAAECGGAGIYSGPESNVTYSDVTFDAVGTEVVADGTLRERSESPEQS